MNDSQIVDYIKDRAEYNFKYKGEIELGTPLSDFVEDEMDFSEFMIDFENKYKLQVAEDYYTEAYKSLKTVKDLVKFIKSKGKSSNNSKKASESKDTEIDMEKVEDTIDDVAEKAKDMLSGLFKKD
ncbi:MAG TPA: hypothetical protein ENI23_08615 [bacterium]|nr:hypothetical protein [bacterium]